MSTQQSSDSSSADDHRPADQQARAAQARPNVNDPAREAAPGTPNYGDFGTAQPADAAPAAPRTNDGSNDNPDEFSEFRKPNKTGTEDYAPETQQAAAEQPGHVEQNQNTAAVAAAQDQDNDVQRTAWADDDPRYGSGQRTSWPSNEPNNISTDTEHDGQEATR